MIFVLGVIIGLLLLVGFCIKQLFNHKHYAETGEAKGALKTAKKLKKAQYKMDIDVIKELMKN